MVPVCLPGSVEFVTALAGAPKGVMLGEEARVAPTTWAIEDYGLVPEDRHVFKTSTSFVSILRWVPWPLRGSGSMILVPPGDERDLRVLLEIPNAESHNLHACTEVLLASSWHCPPGYDESAPIGVPIDPVTVVLPEVDEQRAGEIVVGGSAIALGYSGDVAPDDRTRFHAPVPGGSGDHAGEVAGFAAPAGEVVPGRQGIGKVGSQDAELIGDVRSIVREYAPNWECRLIDSCTIARGRAMARPGIGRARRLRRLCAMSAVREVGVMVKKKVANTVDPAQVRQDRIERWLGSPEMLVGAVVGSMATLVLGYAMGIGFGALVEQIRTSAIDSIFDDRGDDRGQYTVLWGMFGFVGCVAAGNLAAAAVRRYQGRPSTPAFPVVLALAGHTVGTWVSSREWLPPLAVGTAVDPVFHEDEEWGFWAWLMYYADWWWPATMLVVTSLAVVLIVRLARRHAEMARERDRLLMYGCRVPADVVEVKARISSSESGSKVVGATVTVSFVDLAEVRRWATCRTKDVGVATSAGAAEVLFDPERPTHEKSIFVALRRRPAVSDWLPVG